MFRDCQTGGENDRLGAGACHGSRRRLRHSVSVVGPETPSTKAMKTARAVPFRFRGQCLTYAPGKPNRGPRLRRMAGCATPTGSAGHAGATANLKLTFHLDSA